MAEAAAEFKNISPSVWRKCDKELQMYKLRKARVEAARALVFEEGGNRWLNVVGGDDPGFMPVGGGSIYKSSLDTQLARLTTAEIIHEESIIRAIDDVIDSLRGNYRLFFKLYYEDGMTVVECADRMSYHRNQCTAFRREIIRRTAFRLWFI